MISFTLTPAPPAERGEPSRCKAKFFLETFKPTSSGSNPIGGYKIP